MRSIIITCVAVFLLVWGVGLFFGYLSGFGKIQMPTTDATPSRPAQLDEQRRIAIETEELRKKAMLDSQYQIQKFKNTLPVSPSLGSF